MKKGSNILYGKTKIENKLMALNNNPKNVEPISFLFLVIRRLRINPNNELLIQITQKILGEIAVLDSRKDGM